MFRVSQAVQLSVVSIALATTAGCATVAGGRVAGHDVHASARIARASAHALVSGPAWLLHVDVDGHEDLSLYTVARKDGTDADCSSGATVEKKRLHPGVSNLVNLNVAADETVCIAPAVSNRTTSVMWHARRLDGGSAAGHGPALAFDGPGQ